MKKYAIILVILLAIGVALGYRLLVQKQQGGQSVFNETASSVRTLQTLDRDLVIEMNNSLYNPSYDHDVLFDLNFQISEEFDALTNSAAVGDDIVDEAKRPQSAVDVALAKFKSRFEEREQELARYVEINSLTSNSLAQILALTKTLQTGYRGDKANQINDVISKTSAEIFRLTLNSRADESRDVNLDGLIADISKLQFEVPQNITIPLANFKSAAQTIFSNYKAAKTSLGLLNSKSNDENLNAIASAFSDHEMPPGFSNSTRNALLAYGLCLLAALLVFGWQLLHNLRSLEDRAEALRVRAKEVELAYEELRETQEQIIQSEKMSSLGQMVAGVAHEINTPLGYVSSNINSLKENFTELRIVFSRLDEILLAVKDPSRESVNITKRLVSTLRAYKRLRGPELMQESEQLINDGDYGLMEMSKLVKTLKDFSRIDRQSTEQVDVHDCIRSSLTISSNHIRDNNVTVVENYATLPKISCYPSKLNQLFLNIITNACQAMNEKGGQLLVTTERKAEHIMVRFSDEGHGMDKETQQKIFEPFFTSKNIGEGTGLGMSIAYKIIEAHNGKIEVESSVGEGTTISVSLPIKDTEERKSKD